MHSHEFDNPELMADIERQNRQGAWEAFMAGAKAEYENGHQLSVLDLRQAFLKWWSE